MSIKYEVSHTEYRNVGGYNVPIGASDGVFDTETQALARASRLRAETHKPHFVTAIRESETGMESLSPSQSGLESK